MKNTIISLILFFIVVGFVIFSNNELIKLCDEISKESSQIEELLDSGNWNESYKKSVKLLELLKTDGFVSSIYINHTDIDELINNTVRATVLIKCHDKAESLSTLHLIKYNADRIKQLQYPTLNNIL